MTLQRENARAVLAACLKIRWLQAAGWLILRGLVGLWHGVAWGLGSGSREVPLCLSALPSPVSTAPSRLQHSLDGGGPGGLRLPAPLCNHAHMSCAAPLDPLPYLKALKGLTKKSSIGHGLGKMKKTEKVPTTP